MSCNSQKLARIRARLARKETSVELAYTQYDELLAINMLEYRLETNEGSQRVLRRKLDKILNSIRILEAEIDHLYGRICGTGLVKMNVRRIGR